MTSARPRMVLFRMVLRAVAGRFAASAGLVWIVGALAGLGQALLVSAVVPDLDLLARMLLGALGTGAALALPVGALVAVVAGTRGMVEEGAWLGLRTLGVSGRAVALPVIVFLSLVTGCWLGMAHGGEPLARTLVREARVAAAVRVAPVEGRTVQLGPWAAALEGDRLHFAGQDSIGVADTWEIQPALTGVVVHLEHGELRSTDPEPTRVRFATLDLPIALAGTAGKVHASERTTPDLLRQLEVSAALGRDAYERWILWKRTLLPLCLIPLGLAAIPLGLARRTPVVGIVGAQLVSLWGVVRVVDQQVSTVGLWGATLIVSLVALAWCVAPWARWGDR